MSRKRLPEREHDICVRLRNARLTIGRSQEYVASRIGIERSTLTNYEAGVSPVRYEVALRFCRQLIVSEEWLATGTTESLQQAALSHGFTKDTNWSNLHSIFLRQCMDLMSDPEVHQIPFGMAFSEAFDRFLAARYRELAKEFYYLPRIIFSARPETDLAEELIACLMERWLKLLGNEALRCNEVPWTVQRYFARSIIEAASHVFRRYMGLTGPATLQGLDWLRDSLNDPNLLLGPLHSANWPAVIGQGQKKDLPDSETQLESVSVKAQLPNLLDRLKKATKAAGKKTELAEFLSKQLKAKVPLASVSRWLSGEREPGGEVALQLDAWATAQGFPRAS